MGAETRGVSGFSWQPFLCPITSPPDMPARSLLSSRRSVKSCGPFSVGPGFPGHHRGAPGHHRGAPGLPLTQGSASFAQVPISGPTRGLPDSFRPALSVLHAFLASSLCSPLPIRAASPLGLPAQSGDCRRPCGALTPGPAEGAEAGGCGGRGPISVALEIRFQEHRGLGARPDPSGPGSALSSSSASPGKAGPSPCPVARSLVRQVSRRAGRCPRC